MTTYLSSTALASSLALAQTSADGGLVHRVFAALPTDPASIFTLLLLVASLGLVLWYGRPRRGKGGKPA